MSCHGEARPERCAPRSFPTPTASLLFSLVACPRFLSFSMQLFEISDVCLLDSSRDVGARNERRITALYCNLTSGFEVGSSASCTFFCPVPLAGAQSYEIIDLRVTWLEQIVHCRLPCPSRVQLVHGVVDRIQRATAGLSQGSLVSCTGLCPLHPWCRSFTGWWTGSWRCWGSPCKGQSREAASPPSPSRPLR